jgi:hypothetical protein
MRDSGKAGIAPKEEMKCLLIAMPREVNQISLLLDSVLIARPMGTVALVFRP